MTFLKYLLDFVKFSLNCFGFEVSFNFHFYVLFIFFLMYSGLGWGFLSQGSTFCNSSFILAPLSWNSFTLKPVMPSRVYSVSLSFSIRRPTEVLGAKVAAKGSFSFCCLDLPLPFSLALGLFFFFLFVNHVVLLVHFFRVIS